MGNQQSKLSVLMGGLNYSGKSAILSALHGVRIPGGPPTSGFHIVSVSYNNYEITIWDSCGHGSWSSYQGADAIIFVVDAADHDRFVEAKNEICQLMKHLDGIPVLIYANKQDLPNAVDAEKLSKILQLDEVKGREWFIQPSCAMKSDDIFEGLDWLTQERNKRKSKDVDVENKKTAEKHHLKALERVMKDKGILEQNLVHGVLIGVPRSGKSSLMKRLLGEEIIDKHNSPSTGVVDKVIQVEVKKSFGTAANVVSTSQSQTKWVRISYNEEALGFGAMLLTTRTMQAEASPIGRRKFTADQNVASRSPRGSGQSSPSTTHRATRKRFFSHSAIQKSHTPLRKRLSQLVRSKSAELPEGYKTTMEIFKEALEDSEKSIEDFQKELEDSWSLYLTDTGGQIEFQELLPLLVSSPSIFFLVFRLDSDMDKLFTIEYLHPTNGSADPYRSTLTIKEALIQSLVSIASMRSFVFKGNLEEGSVAVKPKVFFVATHKDKLDPMIAEDQIKAVDDKLKQIVMSTSLYDEDVVQFASRERLAFTVNNLSDDDTDFEQIRSAVDRIVTKGEFRITLPTSWLFYNLALRRLKGRIISYENARFVAEQNGITSPEELDEVLHFLHSKLGLVRYFPVETLKDIVVLDPQLLFDKVTELIINTFTFEKFGPRVTSEFEKKGIFPANVFIQVSEEEDLLLTSERLIKLLEKLRIIALYQNAVEPNQYFIPCALAHTEDVPKCQEQISSDVPPLVVTFSCGFVPKGVSGSLIVYLLQNEMKSDFEIKLDADTIYKNQLSFSVGPHSDLVTLRIDATHFTVSLELRRLPGSPILCTIEEVCAEIRSSVKKGIMSVLQDLPYAKDIVHSLTFFCPKCDVGCHPGEMTYFKGVPVGMRCSKSRELCNLPDGCKKWLPEYIRQVTYPPVSSPLPHVRQSMPNVSTHNGSNTAQIRDQCLSDGNLPISTSSPDMSSAQKMSDDVFSDSQPEPDTSAPFQLKCMISTGSDKYSQHYSQSQSNDMIDTDHEYISEMKQGTELSSDSLKGDPDVEPLTLTVDISQVKGSEPSHDRLSSTPSLQEAFKILIPVASQWQSMAVLLGVPSNLVDVIRDENSRVNDRLSSMLGRWLNQTDPAPSWNALAEAVTALGNQAKAKEIRDKYIAKD